MGVLVRDDGKQQDRREEYEALKIQETIGWKRSLATLGINKVVVERKRVKAMQRLDIGDVGTSFFPSPNRPFLPRF